MNMRPHNTERGVILLIVLWVVVALSVIAFSFASNVQMGARSIRNARDGAVGYFLAKGAINESIFELLKTTQAGDNPEGVTLFKQLRVAHQPLDMELDSGTAQCWIENEAGKLDLNAGSPLVFRNILVQQFDLDDASADSLVAQWTEWRKQKSDANGNIQGGPLLSVENLLGLSGMKPEFMYGFWRRARDGSVEHHRGLLELATVYSGFNGINLNYAPIEVLQALPGVDSTEAAAIISIRTQHYFESIDDCQQRVPIQFGDEARNLVTVQDSQAFTFVASGRASGTDYDRTVRAVVKFGVNTPLGYQIVYWKDEEI